MGVGISGLEEGGGYLVDGALEERRQGVPSSWIPIIWVC